MAREARRGKNCALFLFPPCISSHLRYWKEHRQFVAVQDPNAKQHFNNLTRAFFFPGRPLGSRNVPYFFAKILPWHLAFAKGAQIGFFLSSVTPSQPLNVASRTLSSVRIKLFFVVQSQDASSRQTVFFVPLTKIHWQKKTFASTRKYSIKERFPSVYSCLWRILVSQFSVLIWFICMICNPNLVSFL